jgi:hypothetical protein
VDAGSLRLGALEAQYCLIFAELLGQGRIGQPERIRLDRTAQNLGLDADRVARLEAAFAPGPASERGRSPRDTLVDLEDPTSLVSPSSNSNSHISVSIEVGRPRAVSVTFEPLHETPEEQTTRVSVEIANARQEDEVHHARFDACARAGRVDPAWCTAAVLVHRNSATREEAAFYERYKTAAPPRPRTALSPDAWMYLFHPDQHRLTSEIFETIAPAALVCRVAAMRADGSILGLDPKQRQDPQVSTVSVVRAVAWSAATLGLHAPPIFVAPELDTGLDIMTQLPPASRAGARMLSGQSAVQLAFHAARHITFFRGDTFVCTLVPTIEDLCDLFIAALSIGAPDLVLTDEAKTRTPMIAGAIAPLLEEAILARLRGLVARFLEDGARIDLQTWARAATGTAGRAGLLLCGDLDVASQLVAGEPEGDQRVRDLERFFASDAATELRARLGIAIGSGAT